MGLKFLLLRIKTGQKQNFHGCTCKPKKLRRTVVTFEFISDGRQQPPHLQEGCESYDVP